MSVTDDKGEKGDQGGRGHQRAGGYLANAFWIGLCIWSAGCTASVPAVQTDGAGPPPKSHDGSDAPTTRDAAGSAEDLAPGSDQTGADPDGDPTVPSPLDGGSPDSPTGAPPPDLGPAPPMPEVTPTTVDNNFTHACAITAVDTEVWCWGENEEGQLGRGTFDAGSARPEKVVGIGPGQSPKVVSIATARQTSCASFADGTVACWGDNIHGELGSNGGRVAAPKKVPGLSDVLALTAGEPSFCAVRANGHVACWGANQFRTVGVDGPDGIRTPTEVKTAEGAPLDQVIDVAGGWQHTCALRKDRTFWCWGTNTFGQLGQPPAALRSSAAPVLIAGVTPTSLGGLGHGHVCVPTAEGKVLCWGKGGRLGRAGTANSSSPVEVQGLTDAVAVDVGAEDTCALHRNGQVSCWGGDDYPSTPTQIEIPSTQELAYGKHEVCAVTEDQAIWCWTGTRPPTRILPTSP